jgi:hypothetical protein
MFFGMRAKRSNKWKKKIRFGTWLDVRQNCDENIASFVLGGCIEQALSPVLAAILGMPNWILA